MIEGVHFVRKRLAGGISRWYVYAWRGGPVVMSADGRKPSLTTEALERIATARRNRDAARKPAPTTIQTLIEKWQDSPEWSNLAPNTQKTWGSCVRAIQAKWEKVPLAIFTHISQVRR